MVNKYQYTTNAKKTSLKSAAVKGVLWSAVDKFAGQMGQFIVSIVLGRLLMPRILV
jgi:O-antigen/teichoic acid export membrane protein